MHRWLVATSKRYAGRDARGRLIDLALRHVQRCLEEPERERERADARRRYFSHDVFAPGNEGLLDRESVPDSDEPLFWECYWDLLNREEVESLRDSPAASQGCLKTWDEDEDGWCGSLYVEAWAPPQFVKSPPEGLQLPYSPSSPRPLLSFQSIGRPFDDEEKAYALVLLHEAHGGLPSWLDADHPLRKSGLFQREVAHVRKRANDDWVAYLEAEDWVLANHDVGIVDSPPGASSASQNHAVDFDENSHERKLPDGMHELASLAPKNGFLGGRELCEALGVPPDQADTFMQQLGRKRRSLGDGDWHEVTDRRANFPKYLYRSDSKAILSLAEQYKSRQLG